MGGPWSKLKSHRMMEEPMVQKSQVLQVLPVPPVQPCTRIQ
eukprot:SAG31_NODE_41939_length_273_cov_5.402299_1_plen_40_part_10